MQDVPCDADCVRILFSIEYNRLTADHGQITVPESGLLRVDGYPVIKDNLLLPPTGDYRAAYLYAKQGKLDLLRTYLKDLFSEQLVIIDSTKALNLGLWGRGDVNAQVCDRLRRTLQQCVYYYANQCRIFYIGRWNRFRSKIKKIRLNPRQHCTFHLTE